MKIVHISDTHLGFKAYSYTDKETGLNQRELDNYRCFQKAIDKIIELKPALVLHTGDLFDSSRPSNYSLDFAIGQLKRLSAAGIKVVLLAGNHSTPKVKEQSHIFKIFRHFSVLHPIYSGEYERFDLDGLSIHAVSQSLSEDVFQEELKKINEVSLTKDKFHVLMLHGAFKAIKEFSMNEFNELSISAAVTEKGFDYIALGHYHNCVSITPNCYYSGSLMPLTFNDNQSDKGFLLIDLKTGQIKPINISSRPLINLYPVDAGTLTDGELDKKLRENLDKCLKGSVCRQKVINFNEDTAGDFEAQSIKKKAACNCLHYQLELKRKEQTDEKPLSEAIGNLQEEFRHFLNQKKLKIDGETLKKMGLAYLSKTYEID